VPIGASGRAGRQAKEIDVSAQRGTPSGSGPSKPNQKPGQKPNQKSGQAKSDASHPNAGSKSKAQQRQAASKALASARSGQSPKRQMWLTVGPVVLVIIVVAVFVIIKVVNGSGGAKSGAAAGQASAAVVSDISSVPAATSNAIGAGTAGQKPFTSLPTKATGAPLTSNGLPRVLYVGADYCPYCAAERWALAVALARFGTFHNLGTTSSSPSDVYPNTATLSFHGTTLDSSTIAFNGYELYTNQANSSGTGYTSLDTLSPADEALFTASGGAFPYINIGGKYTISGASYNPQVLAGLTQEQIAADLSNPDSPVAKGAVGTANVITAAICATTGGQPSAVCTSPGVVAGQAKLVG
jgi:hypothetical protein